MNLQQNLAYSVRTLRKTPAFSICTVLILALGIGAGTAIFSLVSTVLLRELPYRDPTQLVWAWSVRPENRGPFNIPDFLDYRDRNRSLESIAAFAEVNANLIGQGDTVRLQGLRATANFFQLLGAKTELGRPLQPSDDSPQAAPAVVITSSMWRNRLGADPSIIGRKLVLNGVPYSVVGVLSRDFLFPRVSNAEYAIPLHADTDPARAQRRSINLLRVVGRLKPGIQRAQAEADLSSVAQQLRTEYPQANALKLAVQLTPLRDEILGSARGSLTIVGAAVSLLLLIVLVNVANSLLARAAGRGRDLAIRASLGATRGQLIAQPLIESLLLTSSGGILSAVLAKWLFSALRDFTPGFPRAELAEINGEVLWFAAALSVAIGVLIALAPALRSAAGNGEQLRSRGSGHQSRGVRAGLILAEVALSFALLLGAGLMSQTLARLNQVEPGFDSQRLTTVAVSLPRERFHDAVSIQTFLDHFNGQLDAAHRVESHSAVSVFPLSGGGGQAPFQIKDAPVSSDRRPFTNYRFVEPNYFATMRIPLRQGVDFSAFDTASSRPVAIVNEQFAHQFLGNRDPIGVQLMVNDNDTGARPVEIVGVVGNVKQISLDDKPSADLYVPLRQVPNETNGFLTRGLTLVMRASDSRPLAPEVRRMLGATEPEAALAVNTVEDVISASLSTRRYLTILMDIFAAFATALAAFGLYSVISYLTAQRLPEIGIRLALGATPSGVATLIIRQALLIAIAGIILGTAIAAAAYRLAALQLYVPAPFNPTALLASIAALLAIAAIASWLPARRAARLNPLGVLRGE